MWERSPFYGGCTYHNSETGDTVTGYYSPANPLEFEAYCKQWTLNGSGSYESADAAIKAASE